LLRNLIYIKNDISKTNLAFKDEDPCFKDTESLTYYYSEKDFDFDAYDAGKLIIRSKFEILLLTFFIELLLGIFKSFNFKSSKIGDASFIGLDCDSGNIEDCNSGPDESVPSDCQGVLMLSETESRCGLNCNLKLNSTARSSLSESGIRRWTYWSSQAIEFHLYDIN